MMANPNMGWVKTVRAILLIGWNGERIHIAFVAENLTKKIHDNDVQPEGEVVKLIFSEYFDPKIGFVFDHIVISLILEKVSLSTMYLDMAPPLLITMKVLLSA